MSTVRINGKMFKVLVAVDEDRLKALAKTPEHLRDAMQNAADSWHSDVLPKHFERNAEHRYDYAVRSQRSTRDYSKRGLWPLVHTGSMRADMTKRATFKDSGKGVELKMFARVLNLVPNMLQNDQSSYVPRRNGKSYPNIKREVKIILPEEQEAIAAVAKKHLTDMYESKK